MEKHPILLVDDEINQLHTLSGYLKKNRSLNVFTADDGEAGIGIVREHPIEIVLTDIRMPKMDGLLFLKSLLKINPEVSVIMMTAYGSVEDAVSAMKAGAADYLQKPIDLDQLDLILDRVLKHRGLISENKFLKETLETRSHFSQIISASPGMQEVLNLAGRAAQSRATVLIRGESGTGKEVMARAIHFASPRKDKPFVAVNMAAVPENLIESDLFGHEKGAFTGADRQRKGKFEMADQGTLFIDEIGEIPAALQVKLLRVLQERRFERVGGNDSLSTDVRVVSATHQDLEKRIQEGRFREDLYYRLNVICLNLPPLRDRREEIPLFVDHFIRKYALEEDRPVNGISGEALELLMKYRFPGNVRELENIIQRAVVLAADELITPGDLSPAVLGKKKEMKEAVTGDDFISRVGAFELSLIREALEASHNNQSQAARSLGISERHLRYKLKKYGMK